MVGGERGCIRLKETKRPTASGGGSRRRGELVGMGGILSSKTSVHLFAPLNSIVNHPD